MLYIKANLIYIINIIINNIIVINNFLKIIILLIKIYRDSSFNFILYRSLKTFFF